MAEWWYLTAGEPTGPVTEQQMQSMAAVGGLSPTSLVFRDGTEDWAELSAYEYELGLQRNQWGSYFVGAAVRAPEGGGVITQPAQIWPRLKAYTIDYFISVAISIVVFILTIPILVRMGTATTEATATGTKTTATFGPGMLLIALLVNVLLVFGYEIILTAVRGQTVGKLAADIEIVVKGSAETPDLARSTLRALMKALTAGLCFAPINILVWLLTPDRSTIHDLIAGTSVQEISR